MKTAILVLALYYNSMTSQIVPADQCEYLKAQFIATSWSGARAACIYLDKDSKP